MRITLLLIFTFFLHFIAPAQLEGANWYFGTYAGLDFTSGTPTPLFDGALTTGEGCSSVSDNAGNLLFYTDGQLVYDRNHNLMPNGTGLLGHPSSAMSSVICPKPGTWNPGAGHFDGYIICSIDYGGGTNGIRWSEIDMLANGGNGEVVAATKNTHLFGTRTVEGATFMVHENGCDYWLVAKEVDNSVWRSYPVTSAGVGAISVVSNVGPVTPVAYGSIKGSPDSDVIGIANGQAGLQMYDFNRLTGQLTYRYGESALGNSYYSLEYSPSGRYLYYTRLSDPNIYQVDLATTTQAAFQASRTVIGTTANTAHYYLLGALQLAPNGRIYLALTGSTFLGEITAPDLMGVNSNYNDNAVNISGTNNNGSATVVRLGLPSFPGFLMKDEKTIAFAQICNTLDAQFSLSDYDDLYGQEWYITPAGSPYPSTPFTTNQSFMTNIPPGDYDVKVMLDYNCYSDSVIRSVTIVPIDTVDLGPDLCYSNGLVLDAGNQFDSYEWQDGSTNSTFTMPSAGTYTCQVGKMGEDLIYNGDFELGNTGFTSEYSYSTGGLSQGVYTVGTGISNTWWNGCGDHTTGTGNMMILDADCGTSGTGTVSANFWCQLVSVTPNTDYYFSAFIANGGGTTVVPNIALLMNGVQVTTFAPAPGACACQELTYVWNSGAATSVNICMQEISNVCGGADFIVDDISFSSVCYSTDEVIVNPLPTATIAGTNQVCENSPTQTITFTGADGTAPYTFTYSYNGGAPQTIVSTGNVATISVPTTTAGTLDYELLEVSDASATVCSQVQTGNATVTVLPLPTATISGSSTVCVNDAAPAVTFTGANGTAPYIFTYSLNGGPNQTITSTGNVATITVPTTASGTFNYDLISVEDASALTCSQAQTGTVSVQVNPLPTATIAGTNQVCENSPTQTITFTGADGTAPYTFTYSYNGGAPQTIVSTGNVATVSVPTTTAGTFDYELLEVSDASATVCSQVQTGNATVTVLPLPTATISGDDIVCINSPEPVVTFTGANGTAPYIFTYSLNGGPNQTITSTGNVATINVPTTVNGTYSYTLVSVEDASALTCNQAQTGTVEVVVNPLPTATIIGDASVCNGAPEPVVTFTGADGTAPYTFTYNVNGGPNQTVTSTGNTATLNVLTAISGTYDYELISVQDNSSTACIQNQTGTISVEINPIPTASFENIGTCLNTASQFTNSSTVPAVNGANLTAWSWDFGDGNTSNLENPTHTYSDEEVYDVTLTVTSNHGCTNTTTGTGTVYPLPQVSFSPTSVCLDSNTVFTDLSSISNDHTSNTLTDWAWDFGDGTSSTLQNPTHTYAGAGTYTATLTVTSNHGCVSTLTETVIVHPKPTADFSGMNLRGCSPFCAELNSNAVVANPSSVVHYSWTLSNGETHESNQSFFGPCFENNGGSTDFIDVQLTVTTNEGCQNTLEIPNMIEVYHNPIADFYYAPDTPDVINPIVDFYNTSAFADHYEWSMNDAVLTTTNPEYEFPAEPGYHTIRLIAYTDEGCYDTTYNVVEILDKLIFYVPNTFTPDGNNFNDHFLPVFTSGYDAEDYNMVIFNRWGERIFETNEVHFGWNGRDIRTGQEAIPGTYIWKIEFRESTTDKRHIENGHVNLLR